MTERTWSQKLAAARVLRGKGAALLYDRLVLLREVFNDAAYRADCATRKINPEDELTDEVADTCAGFVVLMQTLEKFPDRQVWQRKSLAKLVAAVVDEQQEQQRQRRSERLMVERPEVKTKPTPEVGTPPATPADSPSERIAAKETTIDETSADVEREEEAKARADKGENHDGPVARELYLAKCREISEMELEIVKRDNRIKVLEARVRNLEKENKRLRHGSLRAYA